VIYDYRRQILEQSTETKGLITDLINGFVQEAVAQSCQSRRITDEQVEHILNLASKIAHIPLDDLRKAGISAHTSDQFKSDLTDYILKNYEYYRGKFEPEQIAIAEKWIMLETVDKAWKQHMLNIDHLKEGIGYRGYAYKNPLYEYKREAFFMFKDMMQQIKWEIVYRIYNLNAAHFNQQELIERRQRELEQIMVGNQQGSSQPARSEKRDKKRRR
jgi:preprotein translocase subunit SecA